MSGGRGGFILFLITTLVISIIKIREGFNLMPLTKSLIFISILIFFSVRLLPFEVADIFEKGNRRLFSYITSSGVNMEETSGRDVYYTRAIKEIKKSPIWGYGIFRYVDITYDYPHNIFLELFLQGGLIYFVIYLFMFTKFIRKIIKIIIVDKVNLILIPLSLYPFVELLFSGSYLFSPFFWFVISYAFNYDLKSKKQIISQA